MGELAATFGADAHNEYPDGDGTAFTLNQRFPGQYYDAESGLHYNYFRDYEPGTGRYVEADPKGLGGGIILFGYVSGSPLTMQYVYGLTEWSGWVTELSAGEGGLGTFQHCYLESKCEDGWKWTVEVNASFLGIGTGTPVSASKSSHVVYEDGQSSIAYPRFIFSGSAHSEFNGSVGIGVLGFGCNAGAS